MAIVRDIMPAFELFQPANIDAAVALLSEHGSSAWVLAGGLDSFDWLKDRIKRPTVVVDLSQIKELTGVLAHAGTPELLDPWLWTGPLGRTYLVYAVQLRVPPES